MKYRFLCPLHKGDFFTQKARDFLSKNPISRFSNPKGRTVPKTVDFKGFRKYTDGMND